MKKILLIVVGMIVSLTVQAQVYTDIVLKPVSTFPDTAAVSFLRNGRMWTSADGGESRIRLGGVTHSLSTYAANQVRYWKLTGTSALTGNPNITGTDKSISMALQYSGGGSAEFSTSTLGGPMAYMLTDHTSSTGQHRFIADVNGAEISMLKSGVNTRLRINNASGAVFTDQRASSAGIVYAADYSTNYTTRSLVDKAYVDGAITSIGGSTYWKLTGTSTVSSPTISGSGTFSGTWDFTRIRGTSTSTAGLNIARSTNASPAEGDVWFGTSTFNPLARILGANARIMFHPTSIAWAADQIPYSTGTIEGGYTQGSGLTYNGTTFQTNATTATFGSATTFNISGSNAQLIMSGTSSQVRVQSLRAANTSVGGSLNTGDAASGWALSHYAGNNITASHSPLLTSYTFAPTTGTNAFSDFTASGTINSSGGTNIVRGFYYNKTVSGNTGLTNNAFESTNGNIVTDGGGRLLMTSAQASTTTASASITNTANDIRVGLALVNANAGSAALIKQVFTNNSAANGEIFLTSSTHATPHAFDFNAVAGALNLQTAGTTRLSFANGGITQDDTKSQVLTYDATTKQVYWRDAATIDGAGTGLDGTMVSTRVPFGVDANTLTTDAGFSFNTTGDVLTVGDLTVSGLPASSGVLYNDATDVDNEGDFTYNPSDNLLSITSTIGGLINNNIAGTLYSYLDYNSVKFADIAGTYSLDVTAGSGDVTMALTGSAADDFTISAKGNMKLESTNAQFEIEALNGGMTIVTGGQITIDAGLGVDSHVVIGSGNDNLWVNGGVENSGASGMKHQRVTTGSLGSGASTVVTLTWGSPFADANYTCTCAVEDTTAATASLSVVHIESKTSSAVGVRINNTSAGAITGTLSCIAMHD